MPHADALNRSPYEPGEMSANIEDVGLLHIELGDLLLCAHLQDPEWKRIHEALSHKNSDEASRQIHNDYALKENRVFRKEAGGLRWAVPRAARQRIVKICHDDIGHPGIEKTSNKLRADYWFPYSKRYVKEYISSCLECLYNKGPSGKQPGQLYPIEKVAKAMDTVHIDHLGPFVLSTNKNTQILVVVDSFTKFTFAKAVKNTQVGPVIRMLESIKEFFGFPRRIISDRGTAFMSHKFKGFCRENGIVHVATAVATPRANGQVERYNRTILSMLSASARDDRR